jgi:glucose/arabinose dehydrogenase
MFAPLLISCAVPEDGPAEDDSLVDVTYPNKIVYKQDIEDESELKQDCRNREGEFNSCGSGCPEDADVCATVCVPVCDLSQTPDDNGDDDKQAKEVDFLSDNSTPSNRVSVSAGGREFDLNVPEGFTIEVLTDDVSGARVLSGVDGLGNRWVSRTDEGIISLLTFNEDGSFDRVDDIFTDLNRPHGLALDPQDNMVLYYAETDAIWRAQLYTDAQPEKLADLPGGGRHFTRTIMFGPDGKLYISIGSSCDVCEEENEKRAAIYRMDKDGTNLEAVAEGLRNAVFMATNPVSGEIWVTEMGRDHLGDNLPPDEINIVQEGEHYGWPYCYGDQIRDEQFKADADFDCQDTVPSHVNLQAHSAPLGLDFIPEEGWPSEYRLDLLVAYHGSWNRSTPTGYKVMRILLNDSGKPQGASNFITGWLQENGNDIGRPVDVVADPGGILYITDDKLGTIYRVTRPSDEQRNGNGNGNDSDDQSGVIDVTTPQVNATVSSPVTVEGQAVGPWFFEGQLSAEVRNGNDDVIGEGVLTAQGEWMTEAMVGFEGEIEFDDPDTAVGSLVIKKANPSGLPVNAAQYEVPITFE